MHHKSVFIIALVYYTEKWRKFNLAVTGKSQSWGFDINWGLFDAVHNKESEDLRTDILQNYLKINFCRNYFHKNMFGQFIMEVCYKEIGSVSDACCLVTR